MKDTILVLDDEMIITSALTSLIKMMTKFDVVSKNEPEEALEYLSNNHVDIIVSDFMMPGMNGLEFLKKARTLNRDAVTIMLTGYADKENAIKSINEIGLYYYMEKPWENASLLKTMQNGMEKKHLDEELKKKIIELEKSKIEIERMYELLKKDYNVEEDNIRSIMISLANLIEAKDAYTDGHTRRVSILSRRIGIKLGMEEARVQNLEIAALIHDIGKVGINENVLNKPGKLTDEEYEEIKKHASLGESICKPLKSMQNCIDAVVHHHEKLDGSGYPHGLKGDEISLEARILSVADIFDALYSDRPYRKKLELKKVREIMYEEVDKGTIDLNILNVLFELVDNKELDDVIYG